MKFAELLSRITGFSTPVFGISWSPPESEVSVARRVLSFLEDRRVLYNPYYLEEPKYCIQSVIEIRQFLSKEIGGLSANSKLSSHLRGIRAACRKFLDTVQENSYRCLNPHRPSPSGARFFTALGELRASIGIHVAAIAVSYGLDIEGDLKSILPELDQESS